MKNGASYDMIKNNKFAGAGRPEGRRFMAVHQSGEDYLEAVLILRQKNGQVRSIDVAQYLGYSKPSVSRAVSILKADGHMIMEADGRLVLTPTGEEIAREIYNRHQLLTQFLMELGVSQEVAEQDACQIEHHLSAETYDCLRRYQVRRQGEHE